MNSREKRLSSGLRSFHTHNVLNSTSDSDSDCAPTLSSHNDTYIMLV